MRTHFDRPANLAFWPPGVRGSQNFMLDQLENNNADSHFVNETQTKVLAICRKLLNTNNFGLDDNFFDSGGHSLLAMILALELESQLGVKVGLEKLFGRPTVRALCASLSEDATAGHAVVLPLTAGSASRNLYFIHAAFEFSPLCDGLLPDIAASFVTINDRKWLQQLMTDNDILTVLDHISSAYAEAIISAQQDGVLYLAGHSAGGIFAVETARKLEKRGVTPDYVFLFDTYLHSWVRRIVYDVLRNGLVIQKLRNLLSDCWSHAFNPTKDSAKPGRSPGIQRADGRSENEFGSLLSKVRERTLQAYRGPERAVACHTVLFQATKTVDGRIRHIDPGFGWARSLGPNLSTMQFAADHFNMIKGKDAGHLAEEIKRLTRLPRNDKWLSQHIDYNRE
jgi:thioesterase domain-containing protein